MPRRRLPPADHAAFAGLNVETIPLSHDVAAAVHVAGSLTSAALPLLCIPGLQRNMSDFAAFARLYQQAGGGAVVLIDLPGRGRATDRRRADDYSSVADARDVASIIAALGIGRLAVLGQGYGGQVAMVLASTHPLLLAGTVLLDAGPVADSRGLVRLRNNLQHVEALRGAKPAMAGFRRILAGDYPGLPPERLDDLIGRTHFLDKRGRARPLYDSALLAPLKALNFDDILAAQWPLYDALTCAPLMLLRTQLTDQVRRETFDEMVHRRPTVSSFTISGQGSPALLEGEAEVNLIAAFVRYLNKQDLTTRAA